MIPLEKRMRFEKRMSVNDGFGNTKGKFEPQFTRSVHVTYKVGGEGVLASRLAGVQLVVLSLYKDPETKTIRSDWQAVDLETNTVFAIKSDPIPAKVHMRRIFLEILASTGVAS